MRLLIVAVLWGAFAAPGASPAQLSDVRKVYMMPMGGGLDQYLANRLTRAGLFIVVVDPKQADAVWSERVDPRFASSLEELYPPAKPEKADKKPETEASLKDAPPKRGSSSGRGNVFLVGVGSRQVVWSTFLKLEDRSPRSMDRAAAEIVKHLKKDLKRE